jgi:hypothetical protein
MSSLARVESQISGASGKGLLKLAGHGIDGSRASRPETYRVFSNVRWREPFNVDLVDWLNGDEGSWSGHSKASLSFLQSNHEEICHARLHILACPYARDAGTRREIPERPDCPRKRAVLYPAQL